MLINRLNRLRKADWEVRIVCIQIARQLVERFHYAKGASNTAVYLHGLYRVGDIFDEQCVGVAWWLPPMRAAAEATHPENWQGVLSLSRLVIEPDVPKNACTFLLARSRKMIDRRAWPCLVTYADEWRGHEGKIYLADNWTPLGLTKPSKIWIKDGRQVAIKATKNRTYAEMRALGAECVGSSRKHKFIRLN